MSIPKRVIAASVRKATADGHAFVFASRSDSTPTAETLTACLNSASLTHFSCKKCSTSMTASADSEPFCISCGSMNVEATVSDGSIKTSVTAESNLVSIDCTSCDHSTLMEPKVARIIASAGGNKIHCSACGAAMHVQASEIELGDDLAEDLDDLVSEAAAAEEAKAKSQTAKADGKPAKASKKVKSDALFDPEFDEGSDLDLSDDAVVGDDDFDTLVSGDPGLTGDDLVDPSLATEPMDDLEFISDPVDDLDDPLVAEPVGLDPFVDAADDLPVPMVPEPELGDPLMDALELDDTPEVVDFVMQSSRLVAMKGHYSIASLTRETAGEQGPIIHSKAFAAGVLEIAKKEGLRSALRASGFKPVLVPTLTKAAVSREVQVVQAKAKQATRQNFETLLSSMALAAAGLSRGTWKGYTNPLRAAFEQTLQGCGARNPRRLAASIFAENGVAYAKTLVELGTILQKKSVEARKEIAEALEMTAEDIMPNAAPPFGSEEREEYDAAAGVSEASLEARFDRPALLRAPQRVAANAQEVEAVTAASSILTGNTPLTFGF